MSILKPVQCRTPSCGSVRLVRHCHVTESPTCDLVKCGACGSYGNAKRWWVPEKYR